MASTIMHLAVTNELIRRGAFRDPDRLRFGAVLPDAGGAAGHLKKSVWGLNKRTYDFEAFRSKFAERMRSDDLYFGYYLHLVQDICYRHFIYDTYNWNPLIPGNIDRLHRDYSIINRYVIDRYLIREDLPLPAGLQSEPLYDLCSFDVDGLFKSMPAYFEPVADDDVFFFTKEMADEYIAEATEWCLKEWQALRSGAGFIDGYDNAWDNKTYSLLETTLNTRELGSYRVENSDVFTRCGTLIRSDVARYPSERDVEYLKRSGITTIIDVRSSAEKEKKPHGLASVDGFDYCDLPIEEGSGVPETAEAIPESYCKIAHTESIRDVFRTIADAQSGVLFGCTAGKDRTGVISALILWLCGVRKSDVVYDYVRTRENNKERFELIQQKYPEIDINIVIPNEANMVGFMNKIEDAYGTVEGYFTAIGVDKQTQGKIRSRLLTDNMRA